MTNALLSVRLLLSGRAKQGLDNPSVSNWRH